MMYTNIGKKLKIVAMIAFYLTLIGNAFSFVVLLCESLYITAFVVLLLAFPAAWLAGAFVYAFGELVDKVCDINATLRHTPETLQNAVKKPQCSEAAERQCTDYTRTTPPADYTVETGNHPIEDSDIGETVCPFCSASLWYLKELVGETVPCPHCGETFILSIYEENE